MRSLWFLITGRPLNLDDCLHLSGSKKVSAISMELRVYESFGEIFFATHYAVRLTWRFETGEVTHEKILAGYVDWKGGLREASMAKANRCLSQVLERIERIGVSVQGTKSRFTEPLSDDIARIHCWT